MSNITMGEMLEASVHFGHQVRYWHPKMAPYLFGQRNKIHIINLEKSLPMFRAAIDFASRLAARKEVIMFVGTKRSAQNVIQEEAVRCGMPFVNRRWLGGLLTNYKTVKQSIGRIESLEAMETNDNWEKTSKKEQLAHKRELTKLSRGLAGIRHMNGLPDAIFIIDVGYENIAVSEAGKLGIPVIGVVDSNNNPDGVDYVIPGNDDAIRSIRLYASGIADAILDGHQAVALGNKDDFGSEFNELDDTTIAVKKEVSEVVMNGAAAASAAPEAIVAIEETVSKDDTIDVKQISEPPGKKVKKKAKKIAKKTTKATAGKSTKEPKITKKTTKKKVSKQALKKA